MGDVVKTLLSNSIKALEQGAFQDFCLSFLPLFDSRFIDLERHGSTADGKTRAGTPDLIKTNSDGSHICVQCSVAKDYWSKHDNINDWKPIEDIKKCAEQITNLKELVLCASQEIPTNLPNVKSEIKEHSKKITKVEITILSISNFEEDICNNRDNKYSEIIKRICPAAYEYLSSSFKRYAAEATLYLYKKYPAPLELIESIVNEFVKGVKGEINNIDFSKLALEVSKVSKSRFQRLPNVPQIKRNSVNEFLLNNGIEGKMYCILGVPKIGKTNWVSQLCMEAEKDGIETMWFDTPYEHEQVEFLQDISRITISKVAGFEIANQYADKKIGVTELSTYISQSKINKKYLIVIDNAEQLSDDTIRNIKDILNLIVNTSIGIILVSSKKLKSYLGNIAAEIYCPIWNMEEIEQLLNLSKIEIEDDIKKYSELLAIFSGGHPLVALSLAKRASKTVDLLPIKPNTAPALYDEDLTEEVKQFLFNELLKDNDHRDFILRLSILVSRFDLALMQFIASNIEPALRTPVNLMLENLKDILIEGDDRLGYQIAFIFKQVAMKYLTDEQRKEIYNKVGLYLMTPKNNVINSDNAVNAIFYAIMAGNLKNALLWALLLLYPRDKSFTKEQHKYLLSQLSIIEALNFPKEKDLRFMYTVALFIMATTYTEIEEISRSNKLLKKLLTNPLKQSDIPSNLPLSNEQINTTITVYLVLNLVKIKDFDTALNIINHTNAEIFIKLNLKILKGEGYLHILIQNGKLKSFPDRFILEMLKVVSLKDDLLLDELFLCFTSLGIIAYREKAYKSLKEILEKEEYGKNLLWNLFAKIAYAQYELESSNEKECLKITEEILNLIESQNIKSNRLKSDVFQMRGDAFYQLENHKDALAEYGKCQTLSGNNTTSFDYAWSNYRMGLSTTDDLSAIEHFNNASISFDKLGYLNLKSRSEGERAVALYQKGKFKEAFDIIVGLAEGYYFKNISEYGPAVTIGLGAIFRLIYELEGKPFEEKSENGRVHPKLEKRVFSRILDIAKPEAGICCAYSIFSSVYKLLGKRERQIESLKIAFNGTPINEADKSAKILSGIELMGLYLEQDDIKGAIKIIGKLFSETIDYGYLDNRPFLCCIFPKIEEMLLKDGKLSSSSYKNILNIIEKNIGSLSEAKRYWWLAEVYMRKGGIDGITEEKYYVPDLLLKSWTYAIKSNNYDVMGKTGHQIGFRYYDKANSFQKIAEIHLSIVLSICKDGVEISRLEIIGKNLRSFWSVVTYRKLTETDLPYWKNLGERTKNIVTKTPEDLHPPLMILFILIANNVKNIGEYHNAFVWAIDKLKNRVKEIPYTEYMYIRHLFE